LINCIIYYRLEVKKEIIISKNQQSGKLSQFYSLEFAVSDHCKYYRCDIDQKWDKTKNCPHVSNI